MQPGQVLRTADVSTWTPKPPNSNGMHSALPTAFPQQNGGMLLGHSSHGVSQNGQATVQRSAALSAPQTSMFWAMQPAGAVAPPPAATAKPPAAVKQKADGKLSDGARRKDLRALLTANVGLADLQSYEQQPPSPSAPADNLPRAHAAIRIVADGLRQMMEPARSASLSDVGVVLAHTCAVPSQRSTTLGRLCSNALNCSTHGDEHRAALRASILAPVNATDCKPITPWVPPMSDQHGSPAPLVLPGQLPMHVRDIIPPETADWSTKQVLVPSQLPQVHREPSQRVVVAKPDAVPAPKAPLVRINPSSDGKLSDAGRRKDLRASLAANVGLADLKSYEQQHPGSSAPADNLPRAHAAIRTVADGLRQLMEPADGAGLSDVAVLLAHTCAVPSQRCTTIGRLCCNGLNCSSHGDEQRAALRASIFANDDCNTWMVKAVTPTARPMPPAPLVSPAPLVLAGQLPMQARDMMPPSPAGWGTPYALRPPQPPMLVCHETPLTFGAPLTFSNGQ